MVGRWCPLGNAYFQGRTVSFGEGSWRDTLPPKNHGSVENGRPNNTRWIKSLQIRAWTPLNHDCWKKSSPWLLVGYLLPGSFVGWVWFPRCEANTNVTGLQEPPRKRSFFWMEMLSDQWDLMKHILYIRHKTHHVHHVHLQVVSEIWKKMTGFLRVPRFFLFETTFLPMDL